MNITLEYTLPNGQPRKVWLGVDQTLRFGRTSRADVVIDSDPSLADVHFTVTGVGAEWHVTSVGSHNSVFVNGAPVNNHVLKHSDELQAGRTLFRIAIDGRAAVPAQEIREVYRPATAIEETQPLRFVAQQHVSKVVEFKLQANDVQLAELFGLLLKQEPFVSCQCYIAFNGKRFGKSAKSWQAGEKDLFELAPEEIRATDSLTVAFLDQPANAELLAEAQQASRSDAACLIFSPLPTDDFLETHKIVWAWFSRPSIFAQQATLGSSMLAEKLLQDGELVVLFTAGANAGLKILTQVALRTPLQQTLETLQLKTS